MRIYKRYYPYDDTWGPECLDLPVGDNQGIIRTGSEI